MQQYQNNIKITALALLFLYASQHDLLNLITPVLQTLEDGKISQFDIYECVK